MTLSDLPLYAAWLLLATCVFVPSLWVLAWGVRITLRILEPAVRRERPTREVLDLQPPRHAAAPRPRLPDPTRRPT